MSDKDTIYRQAAIDLFPNDALEWDTNGGYIAPHLVRRMIEELPPAQPDNQINLCDSCDYSYPDCPAKSDDVIFGNGTGHDNICACSKYKPSAQPEWGLPVDVDRPLADIEIVSRLRDIQKQIGGDYAIDRAIEVIEAVAKQSTQTAQRWIPCTPETMPKKTGYYLVQYTRKYCRDEMAVAFYSVEEARCDDDYTWEIETFSDIKEVIAWMPLPKPYKGEE